jgi:hypothetical protein
MKFNDYFTGVYVVEKINHKFDGGNFHQTVHAKRMATIEVFRAFGLRTEQEYEAIAKAGVTPTTVSSAPKISK